MRLVDVESAPHTNRDRSARTAYSPAGATALPACKSAEGSAFPLYTLTKFLDPLLEVLFASYAKILAASLCAGNAHRFGRKIRARAAHRQTRKVAGAHGSIAVAISLAHQTGKCSLDGEVLKTTTCGGRIAGAASLFFLLPRSQHQFPFHLSKRIVRIEHHFLRGGSKTHELQLHDIAATGQTLDDKRAIHGSCRANFLAGERICCCNRDAWQRRFAAFHSAVDLKGWRRCR